jgi:hypothetical protein
VGPTDALSGAGLSRLTLAFESSISGRAAFEVFRCNGDQPPPVRCYRVYACGPRRFFVLESRQLDDHVLVTHNRLRSFTGSLRVTLTGFDTPILCALRSPIDSLQRSEHAPLAATEFLLLLGRRFTLTPHDSIKYGTAGYQLTNRVPRSAVRPPPTGKSTAPCLIAGAVLGLPITRRKSVPHCCYLAGLPAGRARSQATSLAETTPSTLGCGQRELTRQTIPMAPEPGNAANGRPIRKPCIFEGCNEHSMKDGYCSTHSYRAEMFGDAAHVPKRKRNKKRDDQKTLLNVDWDDPALTEHHWMKNPSHCPQGHEYTEENTAIYTGRDGPTRRICRTCSSENSARWQRGEAPDRTYTCMDCGAVGEARASGGKPKRCGPCALARHRTLARARQANNRDQTPKGPTFICRECGTMSETPATPGMAPRLCIPCLTASVKVTRQATWRRKSLKKYNLTAEGYFAILDGQGGVCAICGTDNPGGAGERFHIDHDHACCPAGTSCGRCCRGCLCSRCNTALGLFEDDTNVLNRAIEYLQRPPVGESLGPELFNTDPGES